MRVVVTRQVGLDKKPFLGRVARIAAGHGYDLTLCNVGDMMYAEAPDVAAGRILDLPLSRLNGLRRSVFKDILTTCDSTPHVLVNTHATFRWRHGLFYAFDHDQMTALHADLYVVLLDNVDRVHYRLARDGHVDHTLKDLMVWREEEILATELLSQIARGHGCFYITALGASPAEPERVADGASAHPQALEKGDRHVRSASEPVPVFETAEAMFRLIFRPEAPKAYLSFPMSHVGDSPAVLEEIEAFRREMKRLFTCFDPADMDEKILGDAAIAAAREGHRTVEVGPAGQTTTLDVAELLTIIPDIDGQIYVRDFKLIDQSDMIVSLVPELADGRPGLSSGVERELQHAHEATREVFVIWRPEATPSPFVTETATKVFRSVEEATRHFLDNGYVPSQPAGRLFE